MVVILDKAVITIGESAGNGFNIVINNVRRVMWTPQEDVKPSFVMNTTPPIGWVHPHKFVKGEIHCISEAYDAFYANGSAGKAYIIPSGDNLDIPYVHIENTDVNGKVWKYDVTGFRPITDPGEFEVQKEVVRVYPFAAYYVTTTKPT